MIVARTVTAVAALDSATDRSSQLGQRNADSMASRALRSGRGRRGEDPAPEDQGHDQYGSQGRPQWEPSCGHACSAFALAISWSSWAAVTDDTIDATTWPSGAMRNVDGSCRTPKSSAIVPPLSVNVGQVAPS